MSSSRSLTPHDASQYDLIEAAVRETERGRWFLEEYARRNRNADTDVLLGAIHRLESAVTGERGGGEDVVRFRGDLMDMADAIARTRAEVAALTAPDHGESRLTVASEALDSIVRATERATSDILGAAEAVQEAAWTLRETGADGALCDDLDRHATGIYTACSFQDLTAQRTSRIVHTLRYLEDRIASMIGIWGPEEGVPDLDAEARIRRDTAATLNAALDQTDVDRFLDMESPAAPVAPTRPPLSAVALHDDLAFVPADSFDGEGEGAAPEMAVAPADIAADLAADFAAEAVADIDTEALAQVAVAENAVAEPQTPEPAPDAAEAAADRAVAALAEALLAQDVEEDEPTEDAITADEAVAEAALGDLFDPPADTAQPAAEAAPTAAEKASAPAPAEVDDLAAAFLDLDELSIEEKIALFA
ncbi:hypothetical protein ASG52_01110 [Methylobacterium sp. Leaf456]|uniref:hypothetical protein n=1 Tax=Methylobacterium sp. Leaf456 TaxID=1736382 RepID=UPI0006FAA695|nr:hypothetical protein [Methylobacterium sp. Leaf456]KQT61517.1 hypothetical protein ASG52_01110 [Methylobacterium sp. Leaf456]